jgi:hypothetical protein
VGLEFRNASGHPFTQFSSILVNSVSANGGTARR